jgi:putative endonuclease
MGAIQQWFNHCFRALKRQSGSENLGHQAEAMACAYLHQQGLKLVKKNHRSKAGEIDLIMRDKSSWVFVEVKYRSRDDWANAAESVTRSKQLKVINAAKQYLQQRKIYDLVDCRFDVVAIDKALNKTEINWIPHAFY